MDHRLAFGWPPTGAVPFPSPAAATNGVVLLPTQATITNDAAYCVNPVLYAPIPTRTMQSVPATTEVVVAARPRRQAAAEEEKDGIRLVRLLISCADAIQTGDYSSAHANMADVYVILGNKISTAKGIGRVAVHFAAALSQRLFSAYPNAAAPTTPQQPATPSSELHRHFYEAGPFLKFAYSTANKAILDAFEGCRKLHVIDLALMQGFQWSELIRALANKRRHGGGDPPHLVITGIGPPRPTGGHRDELREAGLRLAKLARSLGVPFSFRGVSVDRLDAIRPWMLGNNVSNNEALAVNSVLQLHRLLLDDDDDPDADADPTTTVRPAAAPIDTLLRWITAMRPRVFTVVEQEADHNRPSLLKRLTNAMFHYSAMFDSMEEEGDAASNVARAEPYLRAEIFDILCGGGSARVERHELLDRWRERLARAGLTQVPFGPCEFRQAAERLRSLTTSGSPHGYGVSERDGSLLLGWQGQPLYSVTAWRATGEGVADVVNDGKLGYRWYYTGNGRNGTIGESSGSGNVTTGQCAVHRTFMPY